MNRSLTPVLRRLSVGVLTAGAAAALVVVGPAGNAATLAPVTVTIQAQGTDLSGTVTSPRRPCEDDRKVIVFKQVGARGGGDDVRFASDTTELDNGVGVWSTGNTGTPGKFYAKVKRTDVCRADSSPTVKAVQS